MNIVGEEQQERPIDNSSKKIIKFKPKVFEDRPEDKELYTLEEGATSRFDKTRLLRESTLEYNGFSQDVIENFPEQAEELLTIAREGIYEDRNVVLNEMAMVMGAEAVSYIKGSNHWQEDWQNRVCAFVDIGNDNGKTIIYDTIAEEFSVMNIMDFVLLKDQEYRIVGSEGL